MHGSGLPRQQLVAVLQPLMPSVHVKVPLLAAGIQVCQIPQCTEMRCKQRQGAHSNQVL